MSWGGDFWGGITKGFGGMKLPPAPAPGDPSQPQIGQTAGQPDPLAMYGAAGNPMLAQIANGGKPLAGQGGGPQGPAGMGAGVSKRDGVIATLFGGTPTAKDGTQGPAAGGGAKLDGVIAALFGGTHTAKAPRAGAPWGRHVSEGIDRLVPAENSLDDEYSAYGGTD